MLSVALFIGFGVRAKYNLGQLQKMTMKEKNKRRIQKNVPEFFLVNVVVMV